MAIGRGVREARHRRGLTQRALAALAGVSEASEQRVEAGRSAHLTLDTLQRVAHAAGRPLRMELAPDAHAGPADAGHLAIQELVIRSATRAGYAAIPEMPAVRHGTWRATDVALRHDLARRFLLVECWNTIGDMGAALRSTNRKLLDGAAYTAARWGEGEHLVASCWVVRATSRNRALIAAYPSLFGARFAGSSRAWVVALVLGATPPDQPGLVWCDFAAARLFAWRRPRGVGRSGP